MVGAIDAALDLVLARSNQSPLYVSEYIRSRVGDDLDTLAALERLWVARAQQYDEPFTLDLEEYFENRPWHLPWKRLIVRFIQNFRETSEPLHDYWIKHRDRCPHVLLLP